jgi:hypothetical protein
LSFLEEELNLIKSLDQRKIITTVWGNETIKRKNIEKLSLISEKIGLDLYYKQFIAKSLGKSIYTGPLQSSKKLKKHLEKFPQNKFWITELQAEPWEKNQKDYLSENPKSISPKLLLENYKKVSFLEIETIIFWGFEYWLWRKINGDSSYFELIKQLEL